MKHRFRGHRGLSLGKTRPDREVKSRLTEGVLASNIDASKPGLIQIELWREWRAMLEDLKGLGPVWTIVRNSRAVLAVEGAFPALTFSADQQSASACNGDRSLDFHFPAWKGAAAFDSECHCGRTYGVEFENTKGEIFQRICLAKGCDIPSFAEWIQMHQATGLESHEEIAFSSHSKPYFPYAAKFSPGTLEFAPDLLRTVLITAAQREIQLIASVANEGINQTARINVERASEAHGWLVLSGKQRSLYVESELKGSLYLEPGNLEGEPLWRLTLVNSKGLRLLRLQSGVDGRPGWNQVIREIVLSSKGL